MQQSQGCKDVPQPSKWRSAVVYKGLPKQVSSTSNLLAIGLDYPSLRCIACGFRCSLLS